MTSGAPEPTTKHVAAVVLAAGRSRRMGRDKALLPWAGGTALGTVRATLAAAGVAHVRVVLGPDAPRIAAGAGLAATEVVVNAAPDARGPLDSLRLGLAALAPLAPAAVLVWPVDHPGVSAPVVTALLEAWRADRPPVVRPSVGGRGGHPVLFDAACLSELLAAPPDEGARAVVHAHRDREVRVPCDVAACVDDLDTPQDYERARPPGAP